MPTPPPIPTDPGPDGEPRHCIRCGEPTLDLSGWCEGCRPGDLSCALCGSGVAEGEHLCPRCRCAPVLAERPVVCWSPPGQPREAWLTPAWGPRPRPPVTPVRHTVSVVIGGARLYRASFRLVAETDAKPARVQLRRVETDDGRLVPYPRIPDGAWEHVCRSVSLAALALAPKALQAHRDELRREGLQHECTAPGCEEGEVLRTVPSRAGCAPTDPPRPAAQREPCPECRGGTVHVLEPECASCRAAFPAEALGCVRCAGERHYLCEACAETADRHEPRCAQAARPAERSA